MKRLQVHPVIRDLAITAAASCVNFAAGLAVIALFGRLLGATLLGEYLLLRRVGTWLLPAAHLGLGVGLPRYVAYAHQRSLDRQLEYFAAGFGCILLCAASIGIVLWLIPGAVGRIFFGSAQFSKFSLPLFLLLLGGAAQVAVYGFFRGCLEMKRAAAIQLCVAAIPILAATVLFPTRSVALIASAIGCSMLVVALGFAIPLFWRMRQVRLSDLPARAKELLRYGVSRVPGDVSIGALLAIGPVIAAHHMPMSRVSYLLLATSMLTAMTLSTDPLGLVFLSKLSMMLAQGRMEEVKTHLAHLASAVLQISLFLTVQMLVFTDVLLRALIGPLALEGITIVRIVLLGVPFYLFYTALRSALDAGTVRALNSRNVVLSLVVLVVLIALSVWLAPPGLLLHAIATSLVVALATLAYCTRRGLTAIYSLRIRWDESPLPMGCAMVLGIAGAAYDHTSDVSLAALSFLELGFTLVFVGVCYWCGARWVRVLFALLEGRQPKLATGNHVGQP